MALCLPRNRRATSLATLPRTLSVASSTNHSCVTSAGLALKVVMRVTQVCRPKSPQPARIRFSIWRTLTHCTKWPEPPVSPLGTFRESRAVYQGAIQNSPARVEVVSRAGLLAAAAPARRRIQSSVFNRGVRFGPPSPCDTLHLSFKVARFAPCAFIPLDSRRKKCRHLCGWPRWRRWPCS